MNELEELKPQEVNFSITCDEDKERLTLVLKKCLETRDMICDKLDPRIQEAHKTHKGLTTLRKESLAPWEVVIEKINQSLKGWHVKKEREAIELQQKINKKLAEDAEVIRQQKLKEAELQESEWSKEVAKEEAHALIPQTVELKDCKEAVSTKIEGQYKRSNWKACVVDEDLVPRIWLMPNMQLLEKRAKELKVEGMTIPGVEFWDDFQIITR